MCMATLFAVEDTGVIQSVDPHLSVGMYDVMIFHYDPNVDNVTFFIVKECKISLSRLLNE